MLAKTVQYALRAVVYLGSHQDSHLSVKELAQATSTPASYLSKVMRTLTSQGIITSQRGLGGGVSLKIPVDKLTLWDVVEAFESPSELNNSCPLGLNGSCATLCPLYHELDLAAREYKKVLQSKTIASLSFFPNSSCQSVKKL